MIDRFKQTLRLMLVDDQADDRAMVRSNLRVGTKQSYEFIECSNGPEAIQKLQTGAMPDCMILDMNMPEMDGISILQQLYNIKGYVPLPVIVLTGSSGNPERDFEDAAKALKLGAQDYITKSTLQPEMLARITNNAIERFQLQNAMRIKEEQYRLATEAASLGAWSYTVKTKHFTCSKRCREISHLPLEGDVGLEDFLKNIYPEDKDAVERAIFESLVNPDQQYFRLDYRVLAPDGSTTWVNVRGRTYIMPDNNIQLHGTMLDITDRRKIQTDLANSEQRFRDMADSINQMIWVTRPDGYHEYYNRRWYEYTGVPYGSTDGEEWGGMFHPDDQERAWNRWRHSLETGEPYEIEYRLRRADGAYRWTLGRAECVRDAEGNITKWYGTCTDIQDLVDARQKAEEANIAKTEFLANMSHEIRTPMNAVIGLANILGASSGLTEKQREMIRTLQLSADSLLDLINDLLDISKIEARTTELEKIAFNFNDIIQHIISIMSVKSKEKGLVFHLDGMELSHTHYIGDPTRIKQMLLNLCSNAVKFTEHGSVTVSVSMQPTEIENIDKVSIAVKDTGIGIPRDKQEDIFRKFVQADSSINRKFGGTGLGLAITKTLTEIMGGTIHVASEVGKGSTFTISIPLQRAQASNVQNLSIPSHETAPANGKKPHVLLVEDYAANILVATLFLDQLGYAYDVASSGEEAIQKIKTGNFATVLMDVQMHGLNGLDATNIVRAYEKEKHIPRIPIIGMTAHALAGDRERCIGAGMDDYIAKPFNPDELSEKLAHWTKAA